MMKRLLTFMLLFAVVGAVSAQPLREDSKKSQRLMVKKPNVKDIKVFNSVFTHRRHFS